jgi:hypothetical protein
VTDKFDVLELPFDEAAKQHTLEQIDRLRLANATHLRDIEQMGSGVEFAIGMISTFFETMVELGKLTEDEWLAIQLSWEERFNHQLSQMKAQLLAAIEKERARQTLSRGILTPGGGQKLIVPGR